MFSDFKHFVFFKGNIGDRFFIKNKKNDMTAKFIFDVCWIGNGSSLKTKTKGKLYAFCFLEICSAKKKQFSCSYCTFLQYFSNRKLKTEPSKMRMNLQQCPGAED